MTKRDLINKISYIENQIDSINYILKKVHKDVIENHNGKFSEDFSKEFNNAINTSKLIVKTIKSDFNLRINSKIRSRSYVDNFENESSELLMSLAVFRGELPMHLSQKISMKYIDLINRYSSSIGNIKSKLEYHSISI